MLTEQAIEGFQCNRPGVETLVDKTDAAQPASFTAMALAEPDTTGAEYGDITITRQK